MEELQAAGVLVGLLEELVLQVVVEVALPLPV
jgi:hypothetical protein